MPEPDKTSPPVPPVVPPPEPAPDTRSVAEMVFDVSESASTLIREEIELAKAEVTEKVGKLVRGDTLIRHKGLAPLMKIAICGCCLASGRGLNY